MHFQIFRGSTGKCIYHLADDETKREKLPVTSIVFIPAEVSSRGELLVATCKSLPINKQRCKHLHQQSNRIFSLF